MNKAFISAAIGVVAGLGLGGFGGYHLPTNIQSEARRAETMVPGELQLDRLKPDKGEQSDHDDETLDSEALVGGRQPCRPDRIVEGSLSERSI